MVSIFFNSRWIIPLVRRGTRHNLELIDLYKVLEGDESKGLADALAKNWQNEIHKKSGQKIKPSLLKAITKTYYKEFFLYGLLWAFINIILLSSRPIILAQLIALFSNHNKDSTKMYYYSAALVGVSIATAFFYHHVQFSLSVIGMRIRIATSSLIYRKITKLNHKALGQTAVGQVVNLLSNDVNRFDLLIPNLHAIWVMPIQVAFLLFIMWYQVGISSLFGIVVMVLLTVPVQGFLAKYVAKLRISISKKTDNRVKIMSEVISGIQVIKMYAWEKPFEKLINLARKTEIEDITSASYLRGVYSSCMVFMDRVSLGCTVICFILLGNNISADKVFSLAQTFNILQLVVAISYPIAISLGAESLVSVERLQNFLLLEEKEETGIERTKDGGISLSNIEASWTPNNRTLQNIDIRIRPGTLCAIVGPVGAGKSSLLQILLGEMPFDTGKIQIGGEISYCSQEPWLFQSTVRSNILFGLQYQRTWYKKVVQVCALEKDFEQFPHRDRTIVGEKGVSLSGGQRARINLARAIYRKADIYLLDDPLSAVDTHVGKHLFENCIYNHLKGKTRILVTHQLQYLKKADLIILVNKGKIEAQGTFEELSRCALDFTKLLIAADESGEKPNESADAENADLPKRGTFRRMSNWSALSFRSDVSDSYKGADEVIEEESGTDPNVKPFKSYLLSTKSICMLVLLITLLVLAQAFCAAVDLWLAFWTTEEETRHANYEVTNLQSSSTDFHPYLRNSTENMSKYVYHIVNDTSHFDGIFDYVEVNGKITKLVKTTYAMYFYGALLVLCVVLTLFRSFLFFKTCMMSSINLHSNIFHTLLEAPMRFFDTNPTGRVLNRFSKDMGAIDEVLPRVLLDAVQIFLVMAGLLINIVLSNAYMIIAIIVLGYVFLKFRKWYIEIAKILKHLEGITKSPVFSHVNSSLNGIKTIRSSNAEQLLINEFDNHQDVHTSAWYLTIACVGAFGLWLDIIAVIFLACVTFTFAVLANYTEVNGSLVGLAVSQSLVLTGMLQYGIRQTAEVINQLTSVERVLQYTNLDKEGPFETPPGDQAPIIDSSRSNLYFFVGNTPKQPWPVEGFLEFRNASLRYAETEAAVLKNLKFVIEPGEKVGIVGRTGAGKSSLISALFRLAPLEGSIFVDGVDIASLGLTDLRKKISIIPQEPVLFSETLRYNLDPFDQFEDKELWRALEEVELRDSVDSLEFMVAEGGGNFSVGQRQLICLARAILKNNKILILDEATANVDQRTDSLIQLTIRRMFKDCTVLTIAHRLNTIMDSDKVLVMSFGNMVEFDHPHNLLQIEDGYFHKLVMETGPSMTEQLKEISRNAYMNKKNGNDTN
ncbi:ATP-binding cassette sub-family C member 4-like isoform X2 [Diorhabda carinulata]|uniref:ATP-binding cassette sub-family C member 4-like isoform X2 n=1 Tax=Diorhabda carinulata TaxID=1163345 RepID=UPI0025A2049A|nr:ATP-binding cassette sub-family C member 4-like isoform X2 [Diorhabda carinulata]